MKHPDFAVLTVSWELALRADGYAGNTVKAYQKAVRSLAEWLAERHPEVGPVELERQRIRGWLRDTAIIMLLLDGGLHEGHRHEEAPEESCGSGEPPPPL